MVAIHHQGFFDFLFQFFITLTQLFQGKCTGHQDKPDSIYPVDHTFIPEFFLQKLNQLMDHDISEVISPHLIDGRKMSDSDHHNIGLHLLAVQNIQVFKQAILILKSGQGIHIVDQAIIPYGTGEIIRVTVLILKHNTAAGTYHIPSHTILCTILHIMSAIFAGKDVLNTFVITFLIFGMNMFFPQFSGLIHILSRESEILNRLSGPSGVIVFQVTQIDIAALCHYFKSTEQSI